MRQTFFFFFFKDAFKGKSKSKPLQENISVTQSFMFSFLSSWICQQAVIQSNGATADLKLNFIGVKLYWYDSSET